MLAEGANEVPLFAERDWISGTRPACDGREAMAISKIQHSDMDGQPLCIEVIGQAVKP